MTRQADRAASVVASIAWIGLLGLLVWQLFHEKWTTVWWFRYTATAMFGLVVLVFAIECLSEEMTVRRWATSVLVFTVFGLLFIAAGIFNPATLGLSRWLLIPIGVYYLVAAGLSGAGAKDVF